MCVVFDKLDFVMYFVLMVMFGGFDMVGFGVQDWCVGFVEVNLWLLDWFMMLCVDLFQDIGCIVQLMLLLWGDDDLISLVVVGWCLFEWLFDVWLYVVLGGWYDFVVVYV